MSGPDSGGLKCLLTGGATGIGFRLAQRLLAQGHDVLVCGRRAEALASAAQRLPKLVTMTCDVASAVDRNHLLDDVRQRWGRLDLLVNNAAVSCESRIEDPACGAIVEQALAINFNGPAQLTLAALDLLRKPDRASVLNINTGLVYATKAVNLGYCASKTALHAFTRGLREQLRDSSISVHEAFPPRVATAMLGQPEGNAMTPDVAADKILSGLRRQRNEIHIGESGLLRQLSRISVSLAEGIVNRS
jgi:uncharacterized oxidoreductase